MSSEEYIAQMKDKAERFCRMLDQPEPGLISWWVMLKNHWVELRECVEPNEQAKNLEPKNVTGGYYACD